MRSTTPEPFPDTQRPPAPFELLAIWGETQNDAREAVWLLGLNARQVIALGNRSADTLRGLVPPTRVLILPGADSAAVEDALANALASRPGVPVLDLRPVQA